MCRLYSGFLVALITLEINRKYYISNWCVYVSLYKKIRRGKYFVYKHTFLNEKV